MAAIEFTLEGSPISIQCSLDEKIEEIIKRLITKLNQEK